MGLNAAASATTRLGSWTRTLNEDDALALLSLAQPGHLLAAWIGASHAQLPQGSFPRRREIVRIVCDELLDHDGEHIRDSSFLRLFHGAAPSSPRPALRAAPEKATVGGSGADDPRAPALERADQPLAPMTATSSPPLTGTRS
ncbi:MAG: hypothetical protein IPN01_12170 [Deltaproteobacteria bacterium]|nr:hypothetical protein [Deltaproteobacteria bacterium]